MDGGARVGTLPHVPLAPLDDTKPSIADIADGPRGEGDTRGVGLLPDAMRLITADETGLIKCVELEKNVVSILGQQPGGALPSQDRSQGVTSMCWADPGAGESRFYAARASGVVETWEWSEAGRGFSQAAVVEGLPSRPVAIMPLPSAQAHVVCCEGGEICVSDAQDGGDAGNKGRWDTTPLSRAERALAEKAKTASNYEKRSKPMKAGGSGELVCACVAEAAGVVATGGRERELARWDLATGESSWQAKNVKHDKYNLRQPVWVTACASLDPDAGANRFVVATAYKQVRVYDVRVQNRPVATLEHVGDGQGGSRDMLGLTTLCALGPAKGGGEEPTEVVVGDKAGQCVPIDLRTMKVVGRFAGPAGSVRGLSTHPTLPYMACVGLDRTARVYNTSTRKSVMTSYLKQRLTAVLFDPEGVVTVKSKEEEDEDAKRAKARANAEEEDEADLDEEGEYYDDGEDLEDWPEDSDEEDDEEGGGGGAGGSGGGAKAAAAAEEEEEEEEGEDWPEEDSEEESGEGSEEEEEEEEEPPKRATKQRRV